MNFAKASILAASRTLYLKFVPQITIKTHPERAVYVARAYGPGALKLVIAATSPGSVKEAKAKGEANAEIPHGAYAIKGHGTKAKLYFSPSLSKEIIIPAWWCKTVHVRSQATAHVEWVTESGIQIPCIVNDGALKKGDEVIRYLPPKEKDTAINRKLQLPESKRQKTSDE